MVDVAVTQQKVPHEAAFNNTTTSFHYITHKRNDELQVIITVVWATGSLPLTPFIQIQQSKPSKLLPPSTETKERAYKVIGIRRPQKLQQICGRGEEYKEHVTFLIHTYWTHKYFLYNFCTLGCSILLRKRHKAFRIYFLLLPPPPRKQLFFQQHDCFTHSSWDHCKIQAPKQWLGKHNAALSCPAHPCLHPQSCQPACHLWWTRM